MDTRESWSEFIKWNGNGDGQWGFKKAFDRRWGKKRGIAERKILLNASDIKRGKAFGKDRGNEVKDE